MKKLIFLLVLLCPYLTYTQSDVFSTDCRTEEKDTLEAKEEPWYADEFFLPNYQDSLDLAWQDSFGYSREPENSLSSTLFRIPITFWIYRDGANDDNAFNFIPNPILLQAAIDESNALFQGNNIPIQLYQKCVEFVDVADVMAIDRFEAITVAIDVFRDPHAINIHIHAWDSNDDDNPIDGIVNGGNFYNPIPSDAIFLMRASFIDEIRRQTFSHEIGHFFGLAHTHRFNGFPCMREPVTRGLAIDFCGPNTCHITGDFLCDTPADPNMSRDEDPNNIDSDGDFDLFSRAAPLPGLGGSRYIGNHPDIDLTDHLGAHYQPDEFNVMA